MTVREILENLDALPPMPAVAVKLLEAAQDPDVNLGQVASWLERDPAMTANLIRLCNSPFYGLRAQITSVRQAVSLLGLKRIVQIALTVISSRYLAPAQGGYDLAAGELWKSSVTSAMAAELLAEDVGYPQPSTAYTAGLLQDLGKIVLAAFVGKLLPEIRRLATEDGLGWVEAELRVIGMPHSEVGALLLDRWGFPEALVESVRTHHAPSKARVDPTLARISHLADALTMTLGVGLGADGLAYVMEEGCLAELGITDSKRVEALLERLAERVQQAGELMVPPGDVV